MLKNKFGMLKVVALALTVLMLATLVACNKGMDDAAIQDAINAAVQSQSQAVADEQAKLAASMSEAQAKADAEAKAAQESLLAAQAEAQKKIEEAEKLAAEASKAAEQAKKDAAAEASKAAESAAKAAAEASKAAAEASKAAASLASSLSQSAAAAATATTAPSADADAIAAINAKFQSLKYDYLLENSDLYLAAELKELNLTFEKAAVELTNAMTKEAAESIYAALEVAVAAIENVEIRATAVQALIEDLGDIETNVFTASVEKIVAARDAYKALTEDYETSAQVKVINKIVDLPELTKAEKKLDVLEAYIAETLSDDMLILIKSDNKLAYDAEDDRNELTVSNETYAAVIARATYKYRMLEVINDANVAAANVEIDWDFKLKDGEKIAVTGKTHPITGKALRYELDEKAPIAYFTAEELKEVYILPTLDADFEDFKAATIVALENDLAKAENIFTAEYVIGTKSVIIDVRDIQDIYEDAVADFEAALAGLTFVGDYKGNKVYADAKKDVYAKYASVYVDAVMAVVEESKAYAIELYTEDVYEAKVEELNEDPQYEGKPAILANYLAKAENDLNKFTANVESAPVYDYAGITAEAVRKANKLTGDKVADASKFITANGLAGDFYTYVETVANNSFKKFNVTIAGIQDGTLGLITEKMIADLEAFRDEWTVKDGAMYDTLAKKKAGSSTATPWNPDSEPTDDTWERATAVAALKAEIDAAIAEIKAIKVGTEDQKVQIKWKNDGSAGKDSAANKDYKNNGLWFKEAAAKEYFEDMGYTEADVFADVSMMKTYFTVADKGADLKWTYTYTAEEQACMAAQTAYTNAWKNIYADVVTIMGYEATYTNKINDNDNKKTETAYETALNDAAGSEALVEEITKFGAVYTGNIATAATAAKYENALNGKLYVFSAKSDNINANGTHVTLKYEPATEQYASELFTLANIEAKFQAEVDTCNANAPKVATLFAYKFVAIEKVNAAAKAATIVLDKDGKQVGAPTYAYTADTLAAESYEAAIAAFVTAATEKIMAVKIDNTEYADLSTWNGTKVWSKAKIGYSYDKAVQYIDAIVTSYVGTAGTAVVIEGNVCDYADSAIFQQYKMLIKNNYSGWASLEKAN